MISLVGNAQDVELDSMVAAVKKAPDDTVKVGALLNIGTRFTSTSPALTVDYGRQACDLSKKLGYKRGVASAYKLIGRGYFNQGVYFDALQNYNQSLEAFSSMGDSVGVANIFSNIGAVYFNQGDDVKALDNYIRSLKLSESISDTLRMCTALNNIGAVYMNKPITFDKATEYLQRALPLSEKVLADGKASDDVRAKFLELLGSTTVNLGEIYAQDWKMGNDSLALQYYNRALIAYEGTENMPYALMDIGKLYTKRKEYDKAIEYLKRGYEIAKGLDAKNDMAITLQALAFAYKARGDKSAALTCFKQAEAAANETGAKYFLKEIYEGLSSLYASMGDYAHAFSYQEKLIAVKDTIYNIDQDKKLQGAEFNYQIEKKESQISLLTKDQELKQQEIRRQKLVRNSFIGGFAIMLLFAGVFLSQRNRISKEKKRSDELLLNILPEETAEELKATGTAQAKSFDSVTVMFTDFKNFTKVAEKLSPAELVEYINHCFSEFDRIVMRYQIEKIKTIGDAYMCAGGLPAVTQTHPQDVIKAGLEMQEFMRRHKAEREAQGLPYMDLRLGIHTGPVVAGIVGIKKFAYDVWGDTVNTASRMESSGEPGKVNISGTTFELVKDQFTFTYRGKIPAKNKGDIEMYFVEGVA
ncbi:MAG: adenylate/guanylate cyclase domain-containing protein [Bacteroidota bacterium]